jgi:hypothetical protein
VPISAPYRLTECRRFFAAPATARQRQYEALQAFYMEGLPSSEVACQMLGQFRSVEIQASRFIGNRLKAPNDFAGGVAPRARSYSRG